jgi:hypothetical protein
MLVDLDQQPFGAAYYRHLSPSRYLRQQDSQERETRGPASFAGDKIRAGQQSQNCQNAWADNSIGCARIADEVIEGGSQSVAQLAQSGHAFAA